MTPVLRSSFFDDQCGGAVFLKCENFQRTGAFKFRGAYHALVRNETTAPFHQVVTVSSGNHAPSLAWASQLLGYSAHIVMPEPVNVFKRIRVEELGRLSPFDPLVMMHRHSLKIWSGGSAACSFIPIRC